MLTLRRTNHTMPRTRGRLPMNVEKREITETFTEFLVPLPCVIGDLEALVTLARQAGGLEAWDDEYAVFTDDEHLILRKRNTRSTAFHRGGA
jgi:hypothetical protein